MSAILHQVAAGRVAGIPTGRDSPGDRGGPCVANKKGRKLRLRPDASAVLPYSVLVVFLPPIYVESWRNTCATSFSSVSEGVTITCFSATRAA
jgi:hypothetical protein